MINNQNFPIGSIMAGSGIEELWSTVYASNSVIQMMTGHAYARALRAHSLTQLALAVIIVRQWPDLDPIITDDIMVAYTELLENRASPEASANLSALSIIIEKLETVMSTAACTSRTAKLWKQYFQQVQLIRLFVRAERCGDWELHMDCVRCMLPYFHAGGHILYAKSAHLYYQQMVELRSQMTDSEFSKFTTDGFFTVRRSSKVWAGIWTDMTIEQVLMRAMKTQGGVTRGRGLTDSVLNRWTQTMPACVELSSKFEEYCGIRTATSDQHVELRDARQVRDVADLDKFTTWFDGRFPFSGHRSELISLSNGVIGDDNINCDSALEQGKVAMSKMIGNNFNDVKLKRSDRVRTLSLVNGSVNIQDEVIPINTMQLFNRIICVVKSPEDLAVCLKYELSPQPPSLFINSVMRKANKASLYKILDKKTMYLQQLPDGHNTFVVDGGHLLHRVIWPTPATYSDICMAYVRYVVRQYGVDVTVVFDGYGDTMSTKAEEHRRRTKKATSPDIVVQNSLIANPTQSQFLGNNHNKSQLIDLLELHLREGGVNVQKAAADADTLIVTTGITAGTGRNGNVVIVGDDTDLVVLLIALASPKREILLLKPGTSKVETKVYSSACLQRALPNVYRHMLFVHAMSGCDTTSAPYKKGKKKVLALLEEDQKLRSVVDVFNNCDASPDAISSAGEIFMLALYAAGKGVASLDEQRYFMYHTTVAKQGLNSNFQLASLPPTSAAAKQHSFRVFHQIQLWRGVRLHEMEWGWKIACNNNLFPVTTLEPVAPESILKLIFCNCKGGCKKPCRCRKAGLKCTAMCGQCRGVSCTNSDDNETVLEGGYDALDDIDTDWNTHSVSYGGMEVIIDDEIDE
jgi:hypothetical protein